MKSLSSLTILALMNHLRFLFLRVRLSQLKQNLVNKVLKSYNDFETLNLRLKKDLLKLNKSKEVLEMFEQVLDEKVSVWDFSFDFGEWLASTEGDLLEIENEPLFDLLNDNIPMMLEELKSYNLSDNREWLEKYHVKIKGMI